MRPEVAAHIKEMDDAWGERDAAAVVAAHFAEDGVLRDMTSGEPVTGRAAIAEALTVFTAAFDPLTFTTTLVSDDGTTAVAEWIATGTHTGDFDGAPATGNSVTIHGVNLLRFTPHGEIAEERSYWDSGSLLRQLGLLPS